MGTNGTRWNIGGGDERSGGARVDRPRRRSVYWPCCCWFASSYSTSSTGWNPDDGGDHTPSSWSWTTGRPFFFMSCFKRSNGDQRSPECRTGPFTREPLLETGRDEADERKKSARQQFDAKFGTEGARFTKETSALVRQASNVAAKVQKQQERMSREKHKSSSMSAAWNILRRGSSAECKNNATVSSPPPGGSPKPRQMSLGGSTSPKISLDSAKKHLLHFRRQTTDAGQHHQCQTRPGGGRMSIVAKDWDAVHKVHDPESAVGGVYIGDDDANGSRKVKKTINGKVNGEFQGAFTAMKISESTDNKLSMIDDESKE